MREGAFIPSQSREQGNTLPVLPGWEMFALALPSPGREGHLCVGCTWASPALPGGWDLIWAMVAGASPASGDSCHSEASREAFFSLCRGRNGDPVRQKRTSLHNGNRKLRFWTRRPEHLLARGASHRRRLLGTVTWSELGGKAFVQHLLPDRLMVPAQSLDTHFSFLRKRVSEWMSE